MTTTRGGAGVGGKFDVCVSFQEDELSAVIRQGTDTKQVLMLGFNKREPVEKRLATKTGWFWSRSRQKLWNKGESSGHFLYVNEIFTDCDTDTLPYLCTPNGPTCHTGATTCFFRTIPV